MNGQEHLLKSVGIQALACSALGSTMYGQLLDRVGADVSAGGVFADVLSGHENDPGPSALALRLLGGLHRLVLDGRAPELRRWYPSVGGRWDPDEAWSDIVEVARSHVGVLRLTLDQAPQTNEVGRSAALAGGLLHLTAEYPFPVRLFEIGASAGLNLRADCYLYLHRGGQWGRDDSPVVIEDAWQGRVPSHREIGIIERNGYDISPIDPTTRDGELTLSSYVWPDMTARLRRLRGAIAIARQVPATVRPCSAADAVAAIRPAPGTLTVVWHSVTWQYLSDDERAAVGAGIDALAAQAGSTAPVVHLSMEPQRRAPGSPHEFLVRSRAWPGGRNLILARCAPHGPPVTWE
ncbi:MAG: DUF2332 family protein [Mycobacteriaceae bacterium]|nr:DUF2332 family protein [Mycobacteriaceae bacterium]